MFNKKTAIITLIFLVVVSLMGMAAVSASSTNENKVVFVSYSSAIANLSYAWNGQYSVTPNEPWGGVSVNPGQQELVIWAQAARVNSSTPAVWFNSLTVSKIGLSATDSAPAELHFAFSGTLFINGNAYPIVLGQGTINNGNNNNWWLGGGGLSPYSQGNAAVNTIDGRFQISAGGNNYTFIVTPI